MRCLNESTLNLADEPDNQDLSMYFIGYKLLQTGGILQQRKKKEGKRKKKKKKSADTFFIIILGQ